MISWKQYIFSLIVCVLSCSVISQLISDGKRKRIFRLTCGITLAITLLHPISGITFDELLQFPEADWCDSDYYITAGKKAAFEAREERIKAYSESYILDKAKGLGTEIAAKVTLDENGIPDVAEIRGKGSEDVQIQMQTILTTDLGIPKENQIWIWNQENNSS